MKTRLSAPIQTALIALAFAWPASAQAPQAPQPTRAELVRHMHEHLDTIGAIKAHVIDGDLKAVREPARYLAEHEAADGLPAGWEPHIESLRESARRVGAANNLVAAGHLTGNLARACGDCHLANRVNLDFGRVAKPAEEKEDIVTHMQRHQWSADRMWEGLYGPSDIAWNKGVDLLLDVPLKPDEIGHTPTIADAELKQLTRAVHLIGSRGIMASTPEQRAQLFGEYLSLCAECHSRLGRGPKR